MSKRSILIFLMASIILLSTLSMVTAADKSDNVTDEVDVNHEIEVKSSINAQKTADDNTLSGDLSEVCQSNTPIQKDKKNIKNSKRIIINNQTYQTYFTDKNLNDRVSNGDVLDFQGNFIGNYSMNINKAVNITSSTKDAYISLNTTANDWFGGDDVAAFTITKDGAYTNVSDIHFFNSQIFVKNSHHIIFNNITAIVDTSTVGRGVGQTSIRDNSSFVTVENSTFSTKDQWGGCVLVLAWANNCTIRYNKIMGYGEVGNLFYLTTFNVEASMPRDEMGNLDYNLINVNNTFENNLLIGPGYAQGMCYVICLSGTNNRIINNTVLNYNGSGINVQAFSFDYDMKTLIANNTLIGSNFFMPNGTTVINNTVTGNVSLGARCIIENNTFSNIKIVYPDTILANTTVDNVLLTTERNNITIENCNIRGNLTIRGSSVAEVSSNVTIRNNTIGQNIFLNGSKNITIYNNTIAEQIRISGRNSINNNVSIYNNTIVNNDEYTITIDKKVRGLNISDNYLIAESSIGNDSIYLNIVYDDYIIRNDMTHFLLNQSNYDRFFDENNRIRSEFMENNITFEIAGNMKNRKFIFANASVNFINPKGYNITNSTIRVKEDATLALNNIKVDRIVYELTDSNYNRFFNSDGTLRSEFSTANVTLEIAGNMKNRKFIFANANVNFTNPGGYSLTNSSIRVKTNSVVSLNNINVDRIVYELTDSNYDRYFSSDGTLRSEFRTANVTFEISGNMKNRKFIFTGGLFNLSNPGGYTLTNSTVEVKSDANVTLDNINVSMVTYELTDSNYNRFFTANATARTDIIKSNVTLRVASNIKNKNFTYTTSNVTFTNPNGYNITKSTIEIKANANVSLNNIKVDRIIYELTDSNYNRFFDNYSIARFDMLNDNVTLRVAGDIHNKNFTFTNGRLNFTNPGNHVLTNSTIEVRSDAEVTIENIKVQMIRYELSENNYHNFFNDDGTSRSNVIHDNITLIVASNIKNKNFTLQNARITFINPAGYTLYNATLNVTANAVVYVSGLTFNNTDNRVNTIVLDSKNNIINSSMINVGGSDEITALVINKDNNTITGLNITINNNAYQKPSSAKAISIESMDANKKITATQITNINIAIQGVNTSNPLYLTNTEDVLINNITVNTHDALDSTLLSLENSKDVTIINSQFVSNNGVGLIISNSNDVLVDNNYINTTSDYTVEIYNSTNTNVTNNGLYAIVQEGDASVNVVESQSSVHDNNLLNSLVKITGKLTVYKPSKIQVKVTDLNGNSIKYGNVAIMIQDNLQDSIFENGTATCTYTPQSMDDVDVLAVYTSPNKLQITNNTTLKVSMIATKIALTSVSVLVNQTVELNATIMDELNNSVKDGLITFTDDNGKVLSSYNVTGAKASVTVAYDTFGIYNITANYSNSSYYKPSTAKAKVTVNHVNIDITGNLTVFTPGNITVRLRNQENKSVTLGTVDVKVNGIKENVTFTNGTATVNYTPNSTGKLNITATYTTDGNYNVSKSSSIKVGMIATKTALTEVSSLINQQVTVNATVKDVLNNPVLDGMVSFTDDNGKLLARCNVSGGKASLKLNYTKVGIYNITASYSNSTTYKSSAAKAKATVNQVNIDVMGSLTVFTPGNITVRLSNQENKSVTVGTLEVKVNGIKEKVTFTNGKATFAYTPQSTGKLNITATYTTPDKFTVTHNTTLTVSKIATKLTLSPLTVLVGQNVMIKAVIKDVLNNNVMDGSMSFKDNNNKVLATARVSNGTASFNVSYNKIGVYNITATYINSSTYKDSSAKTNITVNQVNIDIKANPTIYTPGNITVKLTNQNNSIVTSGSLMVNVNNIKQNITFKNGTATFIYTPQNTGKLNITAVYTTMDKFSVNKTITSDVLKIASKLKISSDKKAPRVNEKVKLIFTLTDVLNNKISGQRITIAINNKNYTLTTDKNATASMEYTVNKKDKNITITAGYNGNTSYKASTSNMTLNRTYKLDMELLTGSFNTKPGDTVKLVAHIKDNGVDITGGQLVFKLNGLSLKDEKNNAVVVNIKDGLAVLEYNIPDTLSARTHNLTAVYSSRNYGRVEMTTPMTINKYTTHIDINPVYTTTNNIRIKAQVVDQNNQMLNKKTDICIKINGKSYTFNTINGSVDYVINQTLKDAYYNLTIISGENGKYLSSTVKTLMVKSNSTIKTDYINNTLNTHSTINSGTTKTSSIMSILTGASTVKPGDRLKLIAHISEDAYDITGGQLVFKLNGLSLKNQNNNSIVIKIKDGLGILDYKIPDTLGARTHNLTAVYDSKKSGRVELTTALTTNRLNTHIMAEPLFTSADNTYIKAEIRDDNNQLINRQTTVVIKVDGKSYSLNNTNGKINYKLPVTLSKGLHQITIIAGENGKYLSSRLNTVVVKN